MTGHKKSPAFAGLLVGVDGFEPPTLPLKAGCSEPASLPTAFDQKLNSFAALPRLYLALACVGVHFIFKFLAVNDCPVGLCAGKTFVAAKVPPQALLQRITGVTDVVAITLRRVKYIEMTGHKKSPAFAGLLVGVDGFEPPTLPLKAGCSEPASLPTAFDQKLNSFAALPRLYLALACVGVHFIFKFLAVNDCPVGLCAGKTFVAAKVPPQALLQRITGVTDVVAITLRRVKYIEMTGHKKSPAFAGLLVGVDGFEPPTLPLKAGCSEPASLPTAFDQKLNSFAALPRLYLALACVGVHFIFKFLAVNDCPVGLCAGKTFVAAKVPPQALLQRITGVTDVVAITLRRVKYIEMTGHKKSPAFAGLLVGVDGFEPPTLPLKAGCSEPASLPTAFDQKLNSFAALPRLYLALACVGVHFIFKFLAVNDCPVGLCAGKTFVAAKVPPQALLQRITGVTDVVAITLRRVKYIEMTGHKKSPAFAGLLVGVDGFEPPTLPLKAGCSEPASLPTAFDQKLNSFAALPRLYLALACVGVHFIFKFLAVNDCPVGLCAGKTFVAAKVPPQALLQRITGVTDVVAITLRRVKYIEMTGHKKSPAFAGLLVGVDGFEPPTLPLKAGCSEPASLPTAFDQKLNSFAALPRLYLALACVGVHFIFK
ncbi:hypothetical protein, partial [Flaviaesturariibacter flavus]|uniref:hypothetical protein n=1 Tax=Flaviaesturariibacter flavus TaxID=2502780 RepID=UPI003CC63A72